MTKALISVTGLDATGIIARVATKLSEMNINILDITQTVLQDFFTMVMLVDLAACTRSIGEVGELLDAAGSARGLSIRVQREDIFNAMHRI